MYTRFILAVAASVLAAPTAAHATTFEGRCVGSGAITTGKPLKVVPAITDISFASTGTCTGSVDGQAITDAPYRGLSVGRSALLSCAGGLASGDSTLTVRVSPERSATVRFRFDDANVLGSSVFALRGRDGGLGWGQHQMTPDSSLVAACLGNGVTGLGNTVSLATVTPLVG